MSGNLEKVREEVGGLWERMAEVEPEAKGPEVGQQRGQWWEREPRGEG